MRALSRDSSRRLISPRVVSPIIISANNRVPPDSIAVHGFYFDIKATNNRPDRVITSLPCP